MHKDVCEYCKRATNLIWFFFYAECICNVLVCIASIYRPVQVFLCTYILLSNFILYNIYNIDDAQNHLRARTTRSPGRHSLYVAWYARIRASYLACAFTYKFMLYIRHKIRWLSWYWCGVCPLYKYLNIYTIHSYEYTHIFVHKQFLCERWMEVLVMYILYMIYLYMEIFMIFEWHERDAYKAYRCVSDPLYFMCVCFCTCQSWWWKARCE